jgi:hypothetical protein
MKTFLLALALCLSVASASGQVISSVRVANSGCVYTVGLSTAPCPIGPGMVLDVYGSGFGSLGGGVALCDCPDMTISKWSDTAVTGIVGSVTVGTPIVLETFGGTYSNAVPYDALAPQITEIDVGTCSYTPNRSKNLCDVFAGQSITIHGKYFGPPQGQVSTCDCAAATVQSWDPGWPVNASPNDNTIVATANTVSDGSSIIVEAGYMWSNPVPYTAIVAP